MDQVNGLIKFGNVEQFLEVVKGCSMFDCSVDWPQIFGETCVQEAVASNRPSMLEAVLEHCPRLLPSCFDRLLRVAYQKDNLELLKILLADAKAKGYFSESCVETAVSSNINISVSTAGVLLNELSKEALIRVAEKLIARAKRFYHVRLREDGIREHDLALLGDVCRRISASEVTPNELEMVFQQVLSQDDDRLEFAFSFLNAFPFVYTAEYLIEGATKAAETGNRSLFLRGLHLLNRLDSSRTALESLISSLKAVMNSNKQTELLTLLKEVFSFAPFEILLSDDHCDLPLLISMLGILLNSTGKKKKDILKTIFAKMQGKELSRKEAEAFTDCLALACRKKRPSWINLFQQFFSNSIEHIIDRAVEIASFSDRVRFERALFLLNHLGISESQLNSLFTRIEESGGRTPSLELLSRIFPSLQDRLSNLPNGGLPTQESRFLYKRKKREYEASCQLFMRSDLPVPTRESKKKERDQGATCSGVGAKKQKLFEEAS